jgi:hypothetical protein
VIAAVNLFTVEGSQFGIAPDPDEVRKIYERAATIGAHEEAIRAVVNFVWSASGYVHVDRIEEVALAARNELVVPAGIGDYFELSIAWMLLSPAGRWAEADALADAMAPDSLSATSELLWRPLTGLLAVRRGDLQTAAESLQGLNELALATAEAQRTVPSACAVCPWLEVTGKRDQLRRVVVELLGSVDGEWPVVISLDPIVRSLAKAGDLDSLAGLLESLRASRTPEAAHLPGTIAVGDALIAIAGGRAGDAVEPLRGAAERHDSLGFVYWAACVRVELARALAAAGFEDEAATLSGEVGSYLASLGCVYPY